MWAWSCRPSSISIQEIYRLLFYTSGTIRIWRSTSWKRGKCQPAPIKNWNLTCFLEQAYFPFWESNIACAFGLNQLHLIFLPNPTPPPFRCKSKWIRRKEEWQNKHEQFWDECVCNLQWDTFITHLMFSYYVDILWDYHESNQSSLLFIALQLHSNKVEWNLKINEKYQLFHYLTYIMLLK